MPRRVYKFSQAKTYFLLLEFEIFINKYLIMERNRENKSHTISNSLFF